MENSADDDRKKQIVLTQKAFAVQGRIEEEICSQQKRMCRSISESELEAVEAVLIRMLDNMRQDRAKGGKNDGQEDIKYD